MTHPYNPLTNRPALTLLVKVAQEEDRRTLEAALYELSQADLDALERSLRRIWTYWRGV